MIQTISALAIVLASIVLLRVLLRATGMVPSLAGRRALRLVESTALGNRQRLHLVEVEGERLLIGSTEGSVRLLRRLPTSPQPEPSEAAPETAVKPDSSRPTTLWNVLGRAVVLACILLGLDPALAWGADAPNLSISIDGIAAPDRLSGTLQLVMLVTLISVAPSILLMATSFTRILVVMALVRQAIGIHQLPPNQVIVGLALFTTLFVMAPVGDQVYQEALVPYTEQKISEEVALERGLAPIREFLFRHTRESDLALFVSLSKEEAPEELEDVSLRHLLPAFMISELKTAFEIGFMIYLPFLVIDVVIASMLISMGMIVLPPMMIALPFKVMLFVLLDGWNLVLGSLVSSFG